MHVSTAVRKKLRKGLGSRNARRAGTKSMLVGRRGRPDMPSTRLKEAIRRWHAEQV